MDQAPTNSRSEAISAEELPDKLRTLWMKAVSALDLKNFDYAINILQAVLKEEPKFLDGRKRLRESAIKKKEAANKRFAISGGGIGAMKIQPLVKKDPHAAIVALEKDVLGAEPTNPQANQFLFEASILAQMPATAGFALETLVTAFPENTKYMHQLGDFYMGQEFWVEAAQVFGKITAIEPTDLNAAKKEKDATARGTMAKSNFEGSFRDNLRNADEAAALENQERSGMTRDQLQAQIELYLGKYAEDQNDMQAVKTLAELYEQVEEFEEALTYFTWAHHLSNGDVSLEKKVIEINDTFRSNKIAEYEAWLGANEHDPEFATVKADYDEFKNQHLKTQVDEYQQQVDKNPTDNGLRFNLGEALYESGQLKEAIPQLQRAQSSPNLRIKAMMMLGKCYEGRNMNDLAIDQLTNASNELQVIDDTKKELLYTLGLVHEKVGDKTSAMDAYKQIYAVDYGYRDVAERVESSYE